MRSVRRPLVAAALGALAALLPYSKGEPSKDATAPGVAERPGGGEDDTAASCGKCHVEQLAEWKGAAHARAWIDPVFQKWLEGRSERSKNNCARCHVPEPVLGDIGKKPDLRSAHADDGVSCIVCHKYDGKIHGPIGAKTDAHESQKSEYLTTDGSAELCNSCHKSPPSPVLPVGKDWERSYAGPDRKTCIQCHMPEVERALAVDPETKKPSGPVRKTRRHGMLGPRDELFCASAFELSAKVKDGQVVLSVENQAGHRVPGLLIRVFDFEVTQLGADGAELASDKCVISGARGERLEVLSTREFPFAAKPGAKQVRVVVRQRLFYPKHSIDEDLGTVLTQTLDL